MTSSNPSAVTFQSAACNFRHDHRSRLVLGYLWPARWATKGETWAETKKSNVLAMEELLARYVLLEPRAVPFPE